MAGESLGEATVYISANTAELQKGLKQASAQVASVAKEMTIALGAVTAVFTAGVMSALNYGEEIARLSSITGISAETLSRLKYAAEQNETSFQSLTSGLKILTRNVDEANQGNKKMQENFVRLGIAASDLRGMGIDQMLFAVADKFKGLTSDSERAALAMQVFGRSGADLVPILKLGSDGIKSFYEASDRLNNTLSGDDVESLKKFNDSIKNMQIYLRGLFVSIAKEVGPAFENFFTALQKSNLLKDLANMFKDILKSVAELPGWLKLTSAAVVLFGTSLGRAFAVLALFPDASKAVKFWWSAMQEDIALVEKGMINLALWMSKVTHIPIEGAEEMKAQLVALNAEIEAQRQIQVGIVSEPLNIQKMMDDLAAFQGELDSFNASTQATAAAQPTETKGPTAGNDFTATASEMTNFVTDFTNTINKAIEQTKNLGTQAGQIIVNQVQTLSKGFGDAVANMLIYGKNFGESMKTLFTQMAASFISGVIEMVVQWVIFQAIQMAFMPQLVAAGSAAASALAAIWSPVAAMVSLATMGGNAIPATVAILGTTALAKAASLTGYAEGGIAGLHGPEIALVGEREPELITPLSKLGQSAGNTINNYITVNAQVDKTLDIADLAEQLGGFINQELRTA